MASFPMPFLRLRSSAVMMLISATCSPSSSVKNKSTSPAIAISQNPRMRDHAVSTHTGSWERRQGRAIFLSALSIGGTNFWDTPVKHDEYALYTMHQNDQWARLNRGSQRLSCAARVTRWVFVPRLLHRVLLFECQLFGCRHFCIRPVGELCRSKKANTPAVFPPPRRVPPHLPRK